MLAALLLCLPMRRAQVERSVWVSGVGSGCRSGDRMRRGEQDQGSYQHRNDRRQLYRYCDRHERGC